MKNENRLIGEFMGWNYSKSGNTARMNAKDPRSSPYRLKDIQFDTSWNWLMPVVEKIESIEEKDDNRIITKWVHILGKGCIIEIDKGFTPDIIVCSEFNNPMSKIEATYLAVIEFIKLYNKNKK